MIGFCIIFTSAYAALMAVSYGFRPDLYQKFYEPFFVTDVALSVALIYSSLMVSLWLSLPGANSSSKTKYIPLFLLGLLVIVKILEAAVMDYGSPTPGHYQSLFGEAICSVYMISCAFLPAIILFYVCRKGAPETQLWSGGTIAISVGAVGYLLLRLVEPTDDVSHIAIWHIAPMLALCAGGVWFGRRIWN